MSEIGAVSETSDDRSCCSKNVTSNRPSKVALGKVANGSGARKESRQ